MRVRPGDVARTQTRIIWFMRHPRQLGATGHHHENFFYTPYKTVTCVYDLFRRTDGQVYIWPKTYPNVSHCIGDSNVCYVDSKANTTVVGGHCLIGALWSTQFMRSANIKCVKLSASLQLSLQTIWYDFVPGTVIGELVFNIFHLQLNQKLRENSPVLWLTVYYKN
jgi:hypothetical protein